MVELRVGHKACMLCGHSETSEKLYGTLYQLNDVIVHRFCVVNRFPYILIDIYLSLIKVEYNYIFFSDLVATGRYK